LNIGKEKEIYVKKRRYGGYKNKKESYRMGKRELEGIKEMVCEYDK
jgi:hypothetical protein